MCGAGAPHPQGIHKGCPQSWRWCSRTLQQRCRHCPHCRPQTSAPLLGSLLWECHSWGTPPGGTRTEVQVESNNCCMPPKEKCCRVMHAMFIVYFVSKKKKQMEEVSKHQGWVEEIGNKKKQVKENNWMLSQQEIFLIFSFFFVTVIFDIISTEASDSKRFQNKNTVNHESKIYHRGNVQHLLCNYFSLRWSFCRVWVHTGW